MAFWDGTFTETASEKMQRVMIWAQNYSINFKKPKWWERYPYRVNVDFTKWFPEHDARLLGFRATGNWWMAIEWPIVSFTFKTDEDAMLFKLLVCGK